MFRKKMEESFATCSHFCQEMNTSTLLFKEVLNARGILKKIKKKLNTLPAHV